MNRRRVLQIGCGALAARWASGAEPAISPVMTTLSNYMSAARGRALPEIVIEKTKYAILDALAAMISGSELPPGRFAIRFAREYGGEKVSTVWRRT